MALCRSWDVMLACSAERSMTSIQYQARMSTVTVNPIFGSR